MSWSRRAGFVAIVAAVVAAASPSPANAVIGGIRADVAEFRYYVDVTSNYEQLGGSALCGGSIISREWILTAAHCLTHERHTPTSVTVEVQGRHPSVLGWLLHPLWNGDSADGHDLALIRVYPNKVIEFGGQLVQVGSPFETAPYDPDTYGLIMGRGRTFPVDGYNESREFHVAETGLHGDDYMEGIYDPWYAEDEWIGSLMIGAGRTWATACNGDSGSPLVWSRGARPVQIGVASFVKDNCGTATVFAELNGAQLAWVATRVPTVMDSWPGCSAHQGTLLGTPRATYTTMAAPGLHQDGPFRWNIECLDVPKRPGPIGDNLGPVRRLAALQ